MAETPIYSPSDDGQPVTGRNPERGHGKPYKTNERVKTTNSTYKDKNGVLLYTKEEFSKMLNDEVHKYFCPGNVYYQACDNRFYKIDNFSWDDVLCVFVSVDDAEYKLFVPVKNLWSFLPCVASEGLAFEKI